MQVQITYVYHNCFILKIANIALLFDYPAPEYSNPTIDSVIHPQIKDTELYILSSHNHPDHFDPDITKLGSISAKVYYILSDDIIKKNRQFKDLPSCTVAKPEQTFTVQNLKIRTFKSNDQGVAFLIQTQGFTIYFGGDLANWYWDGLTKQEHQLLVDYFGDVLTKLKNWPIDIAFSNADHRLSNWSGAAQFIETLKPRLFVPMHTFGDTQSLAKFLNDNPNLPSPVFHYQQTGDSTQF